MKTVFVTATDTGVGKTSVSLALGHQLSQRGPTYYWKPIETGIGDYDSEKAKTFFKRTSVTVFPPLYQMKDPVSPHLAAERENIQISKQKILTSYEELKAKEGTLIIEGAGGVLVPLAENFLVIDLIQSLKCPSLVVSQDKLGTINHTLLTLQALSLRSIPILGVILNKTNTNICENAKSISHFGKIEILAEISESSEFDPTSVASFPSLSL